MSRRSNRRPDPHDGFRDASYPAASAVVVAPINPVSLAMTCYVLGADYDTVNWNLIATAGTAACVSIGGPGGSHNPTAGATINGLASVAFARASAQYMSSATALSAFLAAAAWSYFDVVKLTSEFADSADAAAYVNDAVAADAASYWQTAQRQTGPTFQAVQYGAPAHSGGSSTFSNAAWCFRQARYDGTNIETRVNSGTWSQVAATSIADLTHNMYFGVNYDSSAYLNGLVYSIGTSKSCFSRAQFDGIKSYMNTLLAQSF